MVASRREYYRNLFKTREKYAQQYEEAFEQSPSVILTSEEIQRAQQFGNDVEAHKNRNKELSNDKYNMSERFKSGQEAEIAIEKFLNREFTDWSIGKCSDYNHSDLIKANYNVGVKSSNYPWFPHIHKTEETPQIIVIKKKIDGTNNIDARIIGVAMPDVLNDPQNRNDDLRGYDIISGNDKKTAFARLDKVQRFRNKEEFENIVSQYKIKQEVKQGEKTMPSGEFVS